MFNIEQMMNTAIDQAMSTESIPIPEGEYEATIQKIELRPVARKDGSEALTLSISWGVTDSEVSAVTGRETSFARQQIWLDLTPEGNFDASPGMNIALGRLRDAIGQNKPGKSWSLSMLQGGYAKILVQHHNSGDGRTFAEVKSVKAL